MDDILEIIAAFLFAGAIAEWRRRRELRKIEIMLKSHYGEKADKLDEIEPLVSTIRRFMTSDVRLALRLDKARKRKKEAELKLAEAHLLRIARAERRAELVGKAKRLLMIGAFAVIFIVSAVVFMIIRARAAPTQSTDPRDHVWVEITRPMLVCMSSGGTRQDHVAKAEMQLAIASWIAGQREPSSCYIFKKGKQVELNPSQPLDAVDFTEYCNECSPYASDYFGPSEKLIGKYTKIIPIPKEFIHYFKN